MRKSVKRAPKKKVVVIGGGTGTYQVLVGLKRYPLDISAVVSMSDSGGSSGRIREDFSMLPPGDLRRALLALSDLPLASKTLETLFNFRFENGKGLKGHSLGNLFLAALVQITGRQDLAIREASKILAVSGCVYPVTLNSVHLVAVLENGKRIFGETNIDLRWQGEKYSEVPIKSVYFKPVARVFPEAQRAIEDADLVVIGPGDLYTSLIPNLLVRGVSDAIAHSRAKVVLVINLMTKPGETDHFKATDFVEVVKNYLGQAAPKLSHLIVNTRFSDGAKTLSWYKRHHSEPVEDNLGEMGNMGRIRGLEIIRGDFVQKGEFLRHDSQKLSRAIIRLL